MKLDDYSYYDSFASLANHLAFEDEMKRILESSKRQKIHFAILHISFEFLKKNDSLLKEVSQKLLECVRRADIIARFKVNEFLLILLNVTKREDAAIVANKLLQEFSETSIKIGISIYPTDGEEFTLLLKNADIAMHLSRAQEGNNYQYCTSDLTKKIEEKKYLTKNSNISISNNELRIFYQPKVDVANHKIIGVEALLRWINPNGEMIYPDAFIPLTEKTGEIIPITEWVLKTASQQIKKWQANGLPQLRVSVNLSTRSLKEKNFFNTLQNLFIHLGVSPQSLQLEISERFLLKDIDEAIEFLKELKKLGVIIAIDNFGSTRSSLNYLKLFKVDYLNIDKMFIQRVTTDPNDAAIVTDIINMAHDLNIKVVAEGVETKEQLLFVQKSGCDEYQGYYLSKPIPPEDWEVFLKNQHLNS